MANAEGRTFRQLQNTMRELVGPDSGTILVADDRYRKLPIAAVPQPVPVPGLPIAGGTDRQTHTDHQRARPLQHQRLGADSRPAVDADGTRLRFFVINPITAKHVIGRYINNSRVSR